MNIQKYAKITALILILALMPIINSLASEVKEPEQSVDVPIIMYHRVAVKSPGTYSITPSELEADLKYLKDNGYNTIFMNDLIDFVNHGKKLPQKPIILTFDDGNLGDYKYLYPLLKQYEMKAVLSVMGKITDEYSEKTDKNINHPYITWQNMVKMQCDGVVEIQNHSYDMHGDYGSKKMCGESAEAYHVRLKNDLLKMQERTNKMLGRYPSTFTYPLGAVSKESSDVLKELNISASLSCYEGMNKISQGESDKLFLLKRCKRSHGVPISRILNKLK